LAIFPITAALLKVNKITAVNVATDLNLANLVCRIDIKHTMKNIPKYKKNCSRMELAPNRFPFQIEFSDEH